VSGVDHAEATISLQATMSNGGESHGTLLEGYQQNTKVHGFQDGLPDSGVLLGRAMEDLLEVEVGDVVTIDLPTLETEIEAKVAGFVDEPMSTLAYMESDALQKVLAAASDPISAEVLALPSFTTVKAIFGDTPLRSSVFDGIEALDDVAVVVDTQALKDLIDEFQVFFYVFIGMMVFFGGAMAFALIFNIVSVNVAERAGEFASMRANGLTHRKVASLIAGENFLLTAFGVIPGLFIGYLAAFALMNSFSSPEFPLTAQLRPLSYVGAALAMFIVAALSLIPAIRAIKRINVGEIVRERAV
jgi:putative ABC transport system permease protein